MILRGESKDTMTCAKVEIWLQNRMDYGLVTDSTGDKNSDFRDHNF